MARRVPKLKPIITVKKRVTIKDLAEELKTTPSTVSRSLNDHSGISPTMKKKVKELAAKRNYRTNAMASGLRTGYSKTIGVIVPMINRDFFSNVISGIEKVAFQNGFNVMICQSHNDIENEIQNINTLIQSSVAGIFVSLGLNTTDYQHFERAREQGFPLIFFDRVPDDIEATKIVIDDFMGAYEATKHLIAMGYTKIAHFGGMEHINIYKYRKAGYVKALEDHHIPVDASLIFDNALTVEEGTDAIGKLMQSDNPPDAVFAASDYSALGAYTWLRKHGVSIPEDFGIVGFGNEKFTKIISPSLSTVNQFSMGMGEYAASTFFEKLLTKDFTPRKKIRLDPELIIRESSSRKK